MYFRRRMTRGEMNFIEIFILDAEICDGRNSFTSKRKKNMLWVSVVCIRHVIYSKTILKHANYLSFHFDRLCVRHSSGFIRSRLRMAKCCQSDVDDYAWIRRVVNHWEKIFSFYDVSGEFWDNKFFVLNHEACREMSLTHFWIW